MKVNILFPIAEEPKGGGNQFLRSLKKVLIKQNVYSELEDADIVLFNSYQNIHSVIDAKKKYPTKLFVHRIDGPIRLYNNIEDVRDDITNSTNKYLADATIFQSNFSKKENIRLGLCANDNEIIIYNAVDTGIFYKKQYTPITRERKVKVVASSWSDNPNKGFDVYSYLDNNLDFSKYDMTFIGNSPIEFKNIISIKPVGSERLAQVLRQNDIYISASKNDPCSNSVLEALACGLPVICRNEGGHPELVNRSGNAGELFDKQEDIPNLLYRVVQGYEKYVARIEITTIEEVTNQYLDFFEQIIASRRKKLSLLGEISIRKSLFRYEHNRISRMLRL